MVWLLLPFSWLYGLGIYCRNIAFDLGIIRMVDVGVPVISVGNVTMGGAGKTPLVEYVAAHCIARGRTVAVVSRGYKRNTKGTLVVSDGKNILVGASEGGDEPVQMAKKLPTVRVVVGAKRVEAARLSVHSLGADTIVMDDGFQHRYLLRNLDIVVVDSTKNLRRMPLIPAGPRREPLSAISRSHFVAFSRAESSSIAGAWISEVSGGLPTAAFRYRLEYLQEAGGATSLSTHDLKGSKFFLFSGIGDHASFVSLVAGTGIAVAGDEKFPDHHVYSLGDVNRLVEECRALQADGLLTTEKDMVRLAGTGSVFNELCRRVPVYHAVIAIEFIRGKETLDEMIDTCVGGKPA